MNYLFFGGILYLHYAYVDLNIDSGYVADSLFYRHKIPVQFREEMTREDDKFRIIFCRIRRKYRKEFEKALDEIENKMSLLGHNDYRAFCDMLMRLKEEPETSVLPGKAVNAKA